MSQPTTTNNHGSGLVGVVVAAAVEKNIVPPSLTNSVVVPSVVTNVNVAMLLQQDCLRLSAR